MSIKQLIRLALGMVALLLLNACGYDPRLDAQAYDIRTSSDSKNATEAQARQHSEDLHQLDVDEREAEIARIEATQDKRIAATNAMWTTLKIFGSISIAALLLATVASYARMTYGLSTVAISAAEVRANLIPIDQVTRQFPLLRQIHGSRYALHNPNTGSVLMLDTSRDEDRQMIAAMGMTQLAGTIAHEAKQSTDPAGLAMMSPKTVHAQSEGIYIGDQYFENAIPLPKGES